MRVPCRRKETRNVVQVWKTHGISTMSEAWIIFGWNEGKMKGKISDKKRANVKNGDLLDWLLAIDATLT